MKSYPEDLVAAKLYNERELTNFPSMTPEQITTIRREAKEYASWHREHPLLHNSIGVVLLTMLFFFNHFTVCELPYYLPWSMDEVGGLLIVGLICGGLHGFLGHSIVTYSVHEGAAHNLIIVGTSRVVRVLQFIANNACRLFVADPIYYTEGHKIHHNKLGSSVDGAFTSFVRPQRLFLSLLPGTPYLGIPAYRPWLPEKQTRSRLISTALTTLYSGTWALSYICDSASLSSCSALFSWPP